MNETNNVIEAIIAKDTPEYSKPIRLCLSRNLMHAMMLDISETKTNMNTTSIKICSVPSSTPENILIDTDDAPIKNTARNRNADNSDTLANIILSFI
jgi:hypothetical protein